MSSPTSLANELLLDAFGRVRESVHETVDGLSAEQLAHQVDGAANTIGWLVWHLARVQDDHVAAVAGTDQVWHAGGWAARFDLPFESSATGYGQDSEQVAAVRVASGELLTGYYDAVHERTAEFVRGLTEYDYARIVDERWTPPVTLAARLVSVVNDDTQHVGQAAFVRGIIERSDEVT